MPDIFKANKPSPTKQVRLSIPEADLSWLEDQAKTHNLTIHEAAAQVFVIARDIHSRAERKAKPASKASL